MDIEGRLKERTSLDGGVLIVICLCALFFAPLVKWAAVAGLAYGAWTIFKKEK
jgi:hypothetical protein